MKNKSLGGVASTPRPEWDNGVCYSGGLGSAIPQADVCGVTVPVGDTSTSS